MTKSYCWEGVKPVRAMKVNVGGNSRECTVDRSRGLPKDLSKSIAVGTRKMVNYA
jgi:hypothetical protein